MSSGVQVSDSDGPSSCLSTTIVQSPIGTTMVGLPVTNQEHCTLCIIKEHCTLCIIKEHCTLCNVYLGYIRMSLLLWEWS